MKKYSNIIVYGVIDKISELPAQYTPTAVYIPPRSGSVKLYDNRVVDYLSSNDFNNLDKNDTFVIIGSQSEENIRNAKQHIEKLGFECVHINSVIFQPYKITAQTIIKEYDGHYEDNFGNKIIIEKSNVEMNVTFSFNRMNSKHPSACSNFIHIKKDASIKNLLIDIRSSNNYVEIGERTRIIGCNIVISEKNRVVIGKDCLFGVNIELRANNSHPIFDLKTKKRLNKKKNITIGNHVWICKNVQIAAGANIPDGCIVAASAITSHKFEKKNCIIAGMPAKITKKNILWSRDSHDIDEIDNFSQVIDKSALDYLNKMR